MLNKAGVFRRDHSALEVVGNIAVGEPLLAPFEAASCCDNAVHGRTLKSSGLRIHHGHHGDSANKVKLQ